MKRQILVFPLVALVSTLEDDIRGILTGMERPLSFKVYSSDNQFGSGEEKPRSNQLTELAKSIQGTLRQTRYA